MSLNTHSFNKLGFNKLGFTKNIRAPKPEKISGKKPTHYLLGAVAAAAMLWPSGPAEAAMVKLGNVDIQIDTTASFGASILMSDRETQFLPAANGGPPKNQIFAQPNGTIIIPAGVHTSEDGNTDTPVAQTVVNLTAANVAGTRTVTLPDIAGLPSGTTVQVTPKPNMPGQFDFDTIVLPNSSGTFSEMSAMRGRDVPNCATAPGDAYGAFCQDLPHTAVGTRPNFDGSINTDDGRLNFDNGDLVSAPIKLTSEIEAGSGNWNAFARITAFYDAVLMDDGSFEREGGGLSDKGQSRAGQNLRLLDAYVDYDGAVGDLPFIIRAGRQVINWGEATFIPGGNSAFSPIDVAAIRRPGAEIKEALLPVEAIYGSIALSQDVSVEAYVGGWDDFRLDAGGTLFGGSDVFTPGVNGGNPHNVYFIGGNKRSGQKFACSGDTVFANLGNGLDGTNGNADDIAHFKATAAIVAAIKGVDGAIDCVNHSNIDVLEDWTEGQSEQERFAAGDTNIVRGFDNEEGDTSFGLALRWYAENLNSTEFAFYYQKVDSRLPYISYRTGKTGVTPTSVGAQASTVGRGAGATGCNALRNALDGDNAAMGQIDGGRLFNPAYSGVMIDDEHDLLGNAAIQAVASGVAANLNTAVGYSRTAPMGQNIAYFQETVCLLTLAQIDKTKSFASSLDSFGQLPTGATNLQMDYNIGLFAEYPEVEIMGFSFNTTAFGWGVQGDFTFRPEMPLQFDTDSLTIASLFNNCAFTTVAGLEDVYLSGSTYSNEFGNIGCSHANRTLQGYTTEHDAYTWDIGTTATFTRSNPLVSLLGADLGILLTEFQGVIAEDIEEMRGDTGGITRLGGAEGITPLTNVCQGGSDLPLNGILSIDDRTIDNAKGYCRPTDSSWGAVLFAQLQYNNVFGTPIALRPTFVYTEGMEGFSPSPLGFWREGVGATSIRLDASYLDALQFGLAYTDYQGDIDRTRNLDRNTLSLNVSYAF